MVQLLRYLIMIFLFSISPLSGATASITQLDCVLVNKREGKHPSKQEQIFEPVFVQFDDSKTAVTRYNTHANIKMEEFSSERFDFQLIFSVDHKWEANQPAITRYIVSIDGNSGVISVDELVFLYGLGNPVSYSYANVGLCAKRVKKF